MKKQLLILSALFTANLIFAQWQPIPIGSSSADVTSMFTYGETLIVATFGDGIFKTEDNGNNWTDISGNLTNKNVNDIRGGAAPTVIWVATDNGAFATMDHINYDNNTSTGLTNTDINYYWFGDGNSENAKWAIGTNGGGVFVSSEINGPWSASSSGITGDGLIINDITGYTDDDDYFVVAATDGGVYYSTDTLVTWVPKNNGLTGDALKVKSIAALGTLVLIATHNGTYYSLDLGDTWVPIVPIGKFNKILVQMAPTGAAIFAVGEAVYYSPDFINFYQLNLSGISGEITSVAQNSTHTFLGTVEDGKGGGMFKKPIEQLITGVADHTIARAYDVTLEQNYPNPFGLSTNISYSLQIDGLVSLTLYDVFGKVVKTLVNEYQNAGSYSVKLESVNLKAGTYFYTLQVGNGNVETKRMLVIR